MNLDTYFLEEIENVSRLLGQTHQILTNKLYVNKPKFLVNYLTPKNAAKQQGHSKDNLSHDL